MMITRSQRALVGFGFNGFREQDIHEVSDLSYNYGSFSPIFRRSVFQIFHGWNESVEFRLGLGLIFECGFDTLESQRSDRSIRVRVRVRRQKHLTFACEESLPLR